MKKILLFTAFVALTVSQSFAQLSTRENYDVKLRLGTRPQAGDAVLQFVLKGDPELFRGDLSNGNGFLSNDFLTYKYYLTDDVVARGGLRWSVSKENGKYTDLDSIDVVNPVLTSGIASGKYSTTERDFLIAGGLEKHFTNSNIFDVYVGGELMLGFGKDKSVDKIDYEKSGDYDYKTFITNSNVVGIGLVSGFNVFIAELPISVGLEYGLTAKWAFDRGTKVKWEQKTGSATAINEVWRQDPDDTNQGYGPVITADKYSKLSNRSFNLNTNYTNNIRLSINLYFSTLANPRNSQ